MYVALWNLWFASGVGSYPNQEIFPGGADGQWCPQGRGGSRDLPPQLANSEEDQWGVADGHGGSTIDFGCKEDELHNLPGKSTNVLSEGEEGFDLGLEHVEIHQQAGDLSDFIQFPPQRMKLLQVGVQGGENHLSFPRTGDTICASKMGEGIC